MPRWVWVLEGILLGAWEIGHAQWQKFLFKKCAFLFKHAAFFLKFMPFFENITFFKKQSFFGIFV